MHACRVRCHCHCVSVAVQCAGGGGIGLRYLLCKIYGVPFCYFGKVWASPSPVPERALSRSSGWSPLTQFLGAMMARRGGTRARARMPACPLCPHRPCPGRGWFPGRWIWVFPFFYALFLKFAAIACTVRWLEPRGGCESSISLSGVGPGRRFGANSFNTSGWLRLSLAFVHGFLRGRVEAR